MKTVTKFQSEDGKLHDTEQQALSADYFVEMAEKIEQLLPQHKDDNLSFANGHGYLECDPSQIELAKKSLILIASQEFKVDFKSADGIIGRYLCDRNSPLYSAYMKLKCIDNLNRMWGQPYFANNPNQGEQIKLN